MTSYGEHVETCSLLHQFFCFTIQHHDVETTDLTFSEPDSRKSQTFWALQKTRMAKGQGRKEVETEDISTSIDTLSGRLETSVRLQPTTLSSNTTSAITTKPQQQQQPTLICDLGYGLPIQKGPRREKILAISKQVVTFLLYQYDANQTSTIEHLPAPILFALPPTDTTDDDLESVFTRRMTVLWKEHHSNHDDAPPFPPTHLTFTHAALPDVLSSRNLMHPVYLSPDSDTVLTDDTKDTTTTFDAYIIGALIDRKTIQTNRSKRRAEWLGIPHGKWNLVFPQQSNNIHPNEPLNMDCVLDGMQTYFWTGNWKRSIQSALSRHDRRHPNRPRHKTEF